MKRSVLVRIGILCALVLAFLLWSWHSESGPSIENGSTVVLEIGGRYVEAPAVPLLGRLLGQQRTPFVALLGRLALLARDHRVGTVVLHVKSLEVGWGKAEEIRAAIARVRAAGHKTIAFLELTSFSPNIDYFVASAADEIHVPPGSALPMVGLAAEHLYLGGLFRKLGIDIEVAKVGKFKSATETLASTHMSEPARLQANALLDSTYDRFVSGIAEGRHLSPEIVRKTIDQGPTQPEELRKDGFIDGIGHLSDLTDAIGAPVVSNEDYQGVTADDVGFDAQAEFALVYASGDVVSGKGTVSRSGQPVCASETVSKAVLDAADDPRFRAIILRIDSPGGSALASEMIWDALKRARKSGKPVIASLSDVGASGGYYVASGADAIVAPALSITGSIGVFALRPIVGKLLGDLDIGVESMTRGEHADFYLSTGPVSPGAHERLQALVEDTYRLFVSRVAAGRKLTTEKVDEIAQGRVWTGSQAHDVGLVDEIGGLHTAVERARHTLGIAEGADIALVPYPPAPTLAEQIQELMRGSVSAWLGSPVLFSLVDASAPPSRALEELRSFLGLLPMNQPLALAPTLPDIR